MITHNELVDFLKSSRVVVDDRVAVKAKGLYAEWSERNADGSATSYTVGDRVRYTFSDGVEKLCSCKQAHTSMINTAPELYTAGWDVIDEEHTGTVEDPIPYDPNMTVYADKYYIYDGVLYKCIRDSGQPLYTTPDTLINNYFELA